MPANIPDHSKISEGANVKIMMEITGLRGSMKQLKGTMECVRGEMNGDVKSLEAKMADAFRKGLQRKEDNDALETKMIPVFKNEENESRKVHDELTFYEGGNNNNEDGRQLFSQQCGQLCLLRNEGVPSFPLCAFCSLCTSVL